MLQTCFPLLPTALPYKPGAAKQDWKYRSHNQPGDSVKELSGGRSSGPDHQQHGRATAVASDPAIKAPTQSKRKRTGKKRLKGHDPEHLYNTLGYTCTSLDVISKLPPPYLSDQLVLYVPSRSLHSSTDTRTFRIPKRNKRFQRQRTF